MLLLLCLLAFQQKETFYAHYDLGVTHLQERQYAAAIEHLEQAIALRADASPNARTYGVQMQAYFPYHQVAWAYLCSRQFKNASRYLKLAYEQKEDQEGGENVSIRMSMIQEAVINLDTTSSPNDVATDLPKSRPDLVPVADLLLKGELADALEYVELLQSSYPDDKTLQELHDSASLRLDEVKTQERKRQDFTNQLESLLEAARRAETNGFLETALQRYGQILRFDGQNSEANAAMVRVRKLLTGKGSDEVAIQNLLDEKDAEKDEAVKALQEQLQITRKQVEDSRRAATRMQGEFDERVRTVIDTQLTPILNIRWNLVPLSSKELLASVTPRISCSTPMNKVALYINNALSGQWAVQGKKVFVAPGLKNFTFQKQSNQLKMVVIDIHGNTIEDTYDYSFEKTRKLVFTKTHKTVMAMVFGSCVGLVFFFNQQRKRRAFRDRFNPYVAGAPILTEKMFYGRTPLLKQILNALHNNSLMVYGERRIGKTSFLHRLFDALPNVDDPVYEFIPVFIDLQGVSEAEFFSALDHEICQVLDERGMETEPQPETVNARTFISRLRKNIGLLKQRHKKKPKLVLLLDEVDVMNSFSEVTNQQLRSVFMKGFAEHIVAVMAGININTRWKSEGSPWYNFFEQIELKPFSVNQASLLINNPVDGIYSYTQEAVARIIEITDGKPYLIQKMCLNLVSYILLNNKRKITAKDVDLVFKDIEKEFYGA